MAGRGLTLSLTRAWHDERIVLGPMEFAVSGGETVALMGPSGAGKTTLLRIAAGLHRRYEGRRVVSGRLAMVFQEPQLLPWRSVLDNIRLASGLSREDAQAALAEVGVADLGGRFAGTLSLGQARRVALARAFAASPSVLLMDEPLVSLDAEAADDVMRLFETLRARLRPATVIVTHAASEAVRLADRVVRLSGYPATLQPAEVDV